LRPGRCITSTVAGRLPSPSQNQSDNQQVGAMSSLECNESSPVRPPKCQACEKPMRLESVWPDTRFINLNHFRYKCDCGWDTDQLIAMKD
jgi:hypothetical protein